VTTGRPAVRVGLLAVAGTLAALALIGADLARDLIAYRAALGRATAVAEGVVADDRGGEGEVEVRWADDAGQAHQQVFSVIDTGRYATGRPFPVAYDPADPSPVGFPADPEETAAEDDLVIPLGIATVAAGAFVLTWALRGLLFRLAATRAPHELLGRALAGESANGRVSVGDSSWIALSGTDERSMTRWQRVMWHPALEELDGRVGVVVHGNPAGRRRVVVELPDGTRLVPVGRLRRREPRTLILTGREDVRSGLILPSGTTVLTRTRWWRRGAVSAGLGAAVALVTGLLQGYGAGPLLPLAGAGAAVALNAWALASGEP
jgi:hypothetical protein